MRTFKSLLVLVLFVCAQLVYAYGLGITTHPLVLKKKLITTEFSGIVSNGKGVGLQARYVQALGRKISMDAGLGVGSGDRTGRFFLGADFEMFPDYGKQPRLSVKTSLERSEEFDTARNIVGVTPTLSKGFSFWGKEAYPFVAIPMGINLNDDSKTYHSQIAVAFGATGKLPIEGYRHLTANIEASIDLSDSFSAVFAGVSYPLD